MSVEYTPHQLELLQKLDICQEEKKLTQNQLAALVGVSKTAISQLRKNNYPSDPQGIFDIIESYFKTKEKAALTYKETGYVNTSISSEICNIIRVCQVKGGLAMVGGDAGIGKTKAARHFVREHGADSVLIHVNPCMSAIRPLLEGVAEKVGAGTEKTNDKLWRSIVGRLSDGMVLIFDESQHLTYKTIEVLRSFSDYFNDMDQTLGICFLGNTDAAGKIGGKRAEFAQISNRTKFRKIYSTDAVKREDIAKLFPMLEAQHMEKEIDLLWNVAKTPQAIRGTVNLFSNAYDNRDYSYNGLVAAMKFMDMQI